jgi:hypothetical protein
LIAISVSFTVVLSLTTPELRKRSRDIAMAAKQHQDPPLKGIRVLEFAGLAPGRHTILDKPMSNN